MMGEKHCRVWAMLAVTWQTINMGSLLSSFPPSPTFLSLSSSPSFFLSFINYWCLCQTCSPVMTTTTIATTFSSSFSSPWSFLVLLFLFLLFLPIIIIVIFTVVVSNRRVYRLQRKREPWATLQGETVGGDKLETEETRTKDSGTRGGVCRECVHACVPTLPATEAHLWISWDENKGL